MSWWQQARRRRRGAQGKTWVTQEETVRRLQVELLLIKSTISKMHGHMRTNSAANKIKCCDDTDTEEWRESVSLFRVNRRRWEPVFSSSYAYLQNDLRFALNLSYVLILRVYEMWAYYKRNIFLISKDITCARLLLTARICEARYWSFRINSWALTQLHL